MATPLGGSSAGAVTLTVKNTDSVTIPQGNVVALSTVANPEEIGAEQIHVPVVLAASGGSALYVGVASSAIPPGGLGTVTVIGTCLVETDGTVTNGAAVRPKAATPNLFEDWATSGQKYGTALEDDRLMHTDQDYGTKTKTYAYCLVSFLGDGGFGAV